MHSTELAATAAVEFRDAPRPPNQPGPAAATAGAGAGLPPVPVPPENPITEEKRVLGKILFWDEQLSSDDSLACGSCHRPAAGGGDPRAGTHPGRLPGTIDNVAGSPGIRRLDAAGRPQPDPVFGDGPQVTPRTAPYDRA